MGLLEDVFTITQPPTISPLLDIRSTPFAGRSLFAKVAIPQDELLCSSDAPFTRTVSEAYRQEVCERCLSQTKVGQWSVFQAGGNGRGVRWFCSSVCKDAWTSELGEVGIAAVIAVEEMVRSAGKRRRNVFDAKKKDDGLWNGAASEQEVELEWQKASKGTSIANLQGELLREDDDVDVFRLVLDGLIGLFNEKEASDEKIPFVRPSWNDLRSLVPSIHNYTNPTSGRAALHSQIRMYTSLLDCLPAALAPLVTPFNVLTIISRDLTNSFGIWETEDGDGLEKVRTNAALMGYAVYPSLSFFNHSCDPNIGKRRHKTTFEFRSTREIQAGEEVAISYLGGGENADRETRQAMLKEGWGFDCGCIKCQREA